MNVNKSLGGMKRMIVNAIIYVVMYVLAASVPIMFAIAVMD